MTDGEAQPSLSPPRVHFWPRGVSWHLCEHRSQSIAMCRDPPEPRGLRAAVESLRSGDRARLPSWSRHQGDAGPEFPGLLLQRVPEPLGPSCPGQEAGHSCCQWLRSKSAKLPSLGDPHGTVLVRATSNRVSLGKGLSLVPRPAGLSHSVLGSQGL